MPELSERVEDLEEMVRTALDDFRKQLWTAMPARVTKDSDGKTVSLQVTIKGTTHQPHGKTTSVDIAVHSEAIVHFTSGGGGEARDGGWTLTHPIKEGDEGLVIYTSRPIDTWVEKGGIQAPVDSSTHSLSGCIFIPGISSKKRRLKTISTSSVQLRSDAESDGKPTHVVDFDATNGKITHSVDGGKHVTTIDKGSGITHKSETKVHIESPKLTSKGTWNHDGGIRASQTIQSDQGLKAPLLDGAPGIPPDVTEYV